MTAESQKHAGGKASFLSKGTHSQAIAVRIGSADEFSLADIAFFPWFEQVAVLERFRKFVMPAECNRILAWREAVARRQGVQLTARSSIYVHGYAQLVGRIPNNVSAA